MNITEYTVEKIVDPTGLLVGNRYEFRLSIDVDEEDELYEESGVGVRAIFAVEDGKEQLLQANFFKRATDEVINFEVEEEEHELIEQFCRAHYADAF